MPMPKGKVFMGLSIPNELSSRLGEDAKKHFRSKTQHVLWICSKYLGLDEEKSNGTPKPFDHTKTQQDYNKRLGIEEDNI